MKRLADLPIDGKRVLIREDLNVPIADGVVTSDARIRAALPTIEMAVGGGARVMVMSHLGRPEEGVPIGEQPESSMAPVQARLSELLGYEVPLVANYLDGFEWPGDARVVLFENVRVNAGEKKNFDELGAKLAALADVFVMDAFGTAHRAQATTEAVARHARVACAGPLLAAELDALGKAVTAPESPVVAVVGGSKVSTKLEVLQALADKVDVLVVGGGIANTFLAATGVNVGASLHEADLVDTARAILKKVTVPLPTDVVVATEISDAAEARTINAVEIGDADMILDLGPESSAAVAEVIASARTVIWNGPVGVFEQSQFAAGTETLSRAIAGSQAFSLAGGGDTLAAIEQFGVGDDISYISTGGGAFLEFVEGKELPAVAALEARADD
tara:strand:- start:1689 stop:2858 length:1170 start_codon:yes stop_codon:yes gene_type:complete